MSIRLSARYYLGSDVPLLPSVAGQPSGAAWALWPCDLAAQNDRVESPLFGCMALLQLRSYLSPRTSVETAEVVTSSRINHHFLYGMAQFLTREQSAVLLKNICKADIERF